MNTYRIQAIHPTTNETSTEEVKAGTPIEAIQLSLAYGHGFNIVKVQLLESFLVFLVNRCFVLLYVDGTREDVYAATEDEARSKAKKVLNFVLAPVPRAPVLRPQLSGIDFTKQCSFRFNDANQSQCAKCEGHPGEHTRPEPEEDSAPEADRDR